MTEPLWRRFFAVAAHAAMGGKWCLHDGKQIFSAPLENVAVALPPTRQFEDMIHGIKTIAISVFAS